MILEDYDPTSRPVRNDNTTVDVILAISLVHILDTVCDVYYFIKLKIFSYL